MRIYNSAQEFKSDYADLKLYKPEELNRGIPERQANLKRLLFRISRRLVATLGDNFPVGCKIPRYTKLIENEPDYAAAELFSLLKNFRSSIVIRMSSMGNIQPRGQWQSQELEEVQEEIDFSLMTQVAQLKAPVAGIHEFSQRPSEGGVMSFMSNLYIINQLLKLKRQKPPNSFVTTYENLKNGRQDRSREQLFADTVRYLNGVLKKDIHTFYSEYEKALKEKAGA